MVAASAILSAGMLDGSGAALVDSGLASAVFPASSVVVATAVVEVVALPVSEPLDWQPVRAKVNRVAAQRAAVKDEIVRVNMS